MRIAAFVRTIISSQPFFWFITVLISGSFGIYLSTKSVTDPFLYYDTGFIKQTSEAQTFKFPENGPFSSLSLAPGRQVLMYQLSEFTGIAPEKLQFLPLGSIIVSSTLFLLCVVLVESPFLACLITVYLLLNLSHASSIYSIFAYALGMPILFGFIYMTIRTYFERKISNIIILLLLFISLNSIHYTLTVWAILFIVFSSILILISRNNSIKVVSVNTGLYSLGIAFIVIYLFFNEALYKSYLPHMKLETLDSAVQRFFSYFIFSPPLNNSIYSFDRTSTIDLLSTFTLLLIFVPIIIGIFIDAKNILRDRAYISSDKGFTFRAALFLMGIVDSLSYSLRGSISTKSFSMIFPILAIMYLNKLRRPWISVLFASLLVFSSIIKIPLFIQNGYVLGNTGITYEEAQYSSDWIENNITNENLNILSDLDLYGKYLVLTTGKRLTPNFIGFDDDHIQYLIENSGVSDPKVDLVAIDQKSSQPVIGFIWLRYNPLMNYLSELWNGNHLSVIYDDGFVWLIKE